LNIFLSDTQILLADFVVLTSHSQHTVSVSNFITEYLNSIYSYLIKIVVVVIGEYKIQTCDSDPSFH